MFTEINVQHASVGPLHQNSLSFSKPSDNKNLINQIPVPKCKLFDTGTSRHYHRWCVKARALSFE
jgi:hypothetical protein